MTELTIGTILVCAAVFFQVMLLATIRERDRELKAARRLISEARAKLIHYEDYPEDDEWQADARNFLEATK